MRFLHLLFIPLTLILTACSKEAPQDAIDAIRPVKIFQVHSAAETMLRKFPAQVHSAERADLAFRVAGELQGLPAKAGMEVKRGAVLAILDPSDYQIKLNDRKARQQLAKSQFQRISDLFDRNQVSQAQYDQSKAELEISNAALNAARTDLSYTQLKAPFSGQISQVYVDNHQPVAAGKTVMMLQVRDQLEVRMQVPESLMANIAETKGPAMYQPEVEFEAIPGKRFLSRYKEHNAQADEATGSFSLTLTLPRPANLNLLPGMSASVHVDLNQVLSQKSTVVTIPAQAVFQGQHQQEGSSDAQVWIVNGDMTLSPRKVTVGKLTPTGIEVLTGLQAGEKLVAVGVHQAHEGMKVRPWVQERGL
ncbi:MAG: RND family efflux transporter MFP subunit [Oleispira sp.]|jgi:RND family efflux transporter MFP subunit